MYYYGTNNPAGEVSGLASNHGNMPFVNPTNTFRGCYNGYKLNVTDANAIGAEEYTMRRGPIYSYENEVNNGQYAEPVSKACNVEINSKELTQRAAENERITEDIDSLAEIKRRAPDYYHILMYFMKEYRKFAGNGGIAAFSLVGDIGKEKGGACEELSTDALATDGANYGIGYIHFAKFLSTLTDDHVNNGLAGGYGSICNSTFETTVETIFRDVQGRVASHTLKGYPVSSSIRVSITKGGGRTSLELKRGVTAEGEMGWNHDASRNAIVFTGVEECGQDGGLNCVNPETDYIAIAYNIWSSVAF